MKSGGVVERFDTEIAFVELGWSQETRIAGQVSRRVLDEIEQAIDSLRCQKEIAKGIDHEDGDFAIAVKDNQPSHREAIHTDFETHLENDLEVLRFRRPETTFTDQSMNNRIF